MKIATFLILSFVQFISASETAVQPTTSISQNETSEILTELAVLDEIDPIHERIGIKVIDFKLEKNSQKTYLQLDLKNIGSRISKGGAQIVIVNEATEVKKELTLKAFSALPGYSYQLLFDLPEGISEGAFVAETYLDFGNGQRFKVAEIGFGL